MIRTIEQAKAIQKKRVAKKQRGVSAAVKRWAVKNKESLSQFERFRGTPRPKPAPEDGVTVVGAAKA